jgi:hypothetical protein
MEISAHAVSFADTIKAGRRSCQAAGRTGISQELKAYRDSSESQRFSNCESAAAGHRRQPVPGEFRYGHDQARPAPAFAILKVPTQGAKSVSEEDDRKLADIRVANPQFERFPRSRIEIGQVHAARDTAPRAQEFVGNLMPVEPHHELVGVLRIHMQDVIGREGYTLAGEDIEVRTQMHMAMLRRPRVRALASYASTAADRQELIVTAQRTVCRQ